MSDEARDLAARLDALGGEVLRFRAPSVKAAAELRRSAAKLRESGEDLAWHYAELSHAYLRALALAWTLVGDDLEEGSTGEAVMLYARGQLLQIVATEATDRVWDGAAALAESMVHLVFSQIPREEDPGFTVREITADNLDEFLGHVMPRRQQ